MIKYVICTTSVTKLKLQIYIYFSNRFSEHFPCLPMARKRDVHWKIYR